MLKTYLVSFERPNSYFSGLTKMVKAISFTAAEAATLKIYNDAIIWKIEQVDAKAIHEERQQK